jgi:hypothetical protein
MISTSTSTGPARARTSRTIPPGGSTEGPVQATKSVTATTRPPPAEAMVSTTLVPGR